jgi:hypothetical protein
MNYLCGFLFRIGCCLVVISSIVNLLSFAGDVKDEPKKAETALEPYYSAPAGAFAPTLECFRPTQVSFVTDKGYITISLKDGTVKLPEGMELDEASRQFWLSLARSFPEVGAALRAKGGRP